MPDFPKCNLRVSKKTQDMGTQQNHGDQAVQSHAYQESKEEEHMHPVQVHLPIHAEEVTCTHQRECGEDGPERLISTKDVKPSHPLSQLPQSQL